MLTEVTKGYGNVRVERFHGLTVDFCAANGVNAIVKGLRAVSDFEYEMQMAQMNYRLAKVETLYMTTNPLYSFLSSSLVKEIAKYGGDVSGLVPGRFSAASTSASPRSRQPSARGRASSRAPDLADAITTRRTLTGRFTRIPGAKTINCDAGGRRKTGPCTMTASVFDARVLDRGPASSGTTSHDDCCPKVSVLG